MITVEFYEGDNDKHMAVCDAPCVPRAGEFVSIQKRVWLVSRVTWCVDHAADPTRTRLRACVVLEAK